MIYQGSKARLIKDILPYIQNCIDSNKVNLYIKPFVGGANVIQHIKRATRIGLDTNSYLIALLRHCQSNPSLTDALQFKVTICLYKGLGRINQCSDEFLTEEGLKTFFIALKKDYEDVIEHEYRDKF